MTKDEMLDWLVENMRCDGCPLYDNCYSMRKNSCKSMLKKYFGMEESKPKKKRG
mgnify:CR=1 FL=1